MRLDATQATSNDATRPSCSRIVYYPSSRDGLFCHGSYHLFSFDRFWNTDNDRPLGELLRVTVSALALKKSIKFPFLIAPNLILGFPS